ncbi:MAG: hypothetical protein C4530_10100 [Desulfobacteraceae bacterium]|nr:MAG: hypothetical protein C4530_10100 [Desulfobacteraceae bacterium]
MELSQRFDIEAAAVFYTRLVDSKKEEWLGGKEGLKRMEALLAKDWDAFIFLGAEPMKVPEGLRRKVFEKIQAGGGVVLSGVDDPELLQAAAENSGGVRFLAGIEGAKAYALGKGRGVRLPARPVIDYSEGWQNAYESWQENLGRAIVWTAGKVPSGELTFELSKNDFVRPEPINLRIKWSGDFVGDQPQLQLWIRKPAGWIAPWPKLYIEAEETLELSLPNLAAGRYHLDCRVVSSAGVENWATIPFEVTSPRKITGIALDPEWSEIGGKISGAVSLSGTPSHDEKVRIDILDKDRRILMVSEFAAGGDRIEFAFDIPAWVPMLTSVEATVMDDNGPLATASRYFYVSRRNRDQFNFLIWDVPRGTLAPYAEESLERTGINVQLAQGNPPPHVAAHDIAWGNSIWRRVIPMRARFSIRNAPRNIPRRGLRKSKRYLNG